MNQNLLHYYKDLLRTDDVEKRTPELTESSAVDRSPDGKYILTGGTDGTVILWDVMTGLTVKRLRVSWRPVLSVAFLPGEKRFLTCSYSDEGGTIRVWDLAADSCRIIKIPHMIFYNIPVVVTPSGTEMLVCTYNNSVEILDIRSGKCVGTLEEHTGIVTQVVCSRDGRYFLTGSEDRTAKLWDVKSQKCLHTFPRARSSVTSVDISTNGRYCLIGSENNAGLYDLNSFDRIHPLEEGSEYVRFLPDGRSFMISSYNTPISIRDTETADQINTLDRSDIIRAAFSPDGRWGAFLMGDSVRVTDIKTGIQISNLGSYQLGIHALICSGDKVMILRDDDTAALLDMSGESIQQLWEQPGIRYAAFIPGTGSCVVFQRGALFIRDINNGKCLLELPSEGKDMTNLSSLSVSPDGRFIALPRSFGDPALVYDLKGEHFMPYTIECYDFISNVTFTADGRYCSLISPTVSAEIVDLETGECVHDFDSTKKGFYNILMLDSVSPDGRYCIAADYFGNVIAWDTETQELLFSKEKYSIHIEGFSFSPDGKYLLICGLRGYADLYETGTTPWKFLRRITISETDHTFWAMPYAVVMHDSECRFYRIGCFEPGGSEEPEFLGSIFNLREINIHGCSFRGVTADETVRKILRQCSACLE